MFFLSCISSQFKRNYERKSQLNNNSSIGIMLAPTDNSNALPVCILCSREDDPGPGLVADLLYVDTLPPDQELVVLGLGLHLYQIRKKCTRMSQEIVNVGPV